jgi:hypothetical protein
MVSFFWIQASGEIAGTSVLALSTSGALTGTAKVTGTSVVTLSTSGALTASALLTSTSSLTLGTSGALEATAKVGGASALVLTASGVLATTEETTGTSALTLSTAGTLAAIAKLTGTPVLTLSTSGALKMIGKLTGTSAVSLSTSGALEATAELSGASALTLATSGVLASGEEFTGTSSLALGASGMLTGTLVLTGTSALALGTFGTLTSTAQLTGTSPLALDTSGVLEATGALSGTSALALMTSGVLATIGEMAGTSALSLSTSGALSPIAKVTGTSVLTLSTSGALKPISKVTGTSVLSLGTSGTLEAAGEIAGVSLLALGASGTLTAIAQLTGTAAVTLGTTGTLGVLPPSDIAGENNANTLLLLHFDEDLGATTFVDRAVGGTAKTILAAEDTQIERVPKWNFGAVGMHGSGSSVRINPTDDFDFGTEDFTVDWWARLCDAQRPHLLGLIADSAGKPDVDNAFTLERANIQGDAISFRLHYRRAGEDLVSAASALIPSLVGAYHHFAIVRSSTLLTLYVDGLQEIQVSAVDVNEAPLDIDCSEWKTYIGRSFEGGALRTADAYFDEFRIQAEAAWSSDFTVPTGPYTRRMETRAIGTHTIRTRHEGRAVGQHGLGIRRHEGRAVGAHSVYNRHESRAVGEHGVQHRHEGRAVGVHDMVVHRHEARAVGTHVVRVSHEARAVGECRILTTRHEARAVGESTIRNRYEGRTLGESRILERYEARAVGRHRVAELAADRYEVYHGIGGADFSTPLVTGPTLPLDAPISGQGVHHLVVRKRNQYGELSENISATQIELDALGDEIDVAPSAPEWIEADVAPGYTLRIKAHYVYAIDGDLAADSFYIMRKIGEAAYAYMATVAMAKADGLARLDWTSSETFEGVNVTARVYALRTADSRISDPITSDLVNYLVAGPVPGPPAAVQVESW